MNNLAQHNQEHLLKYYDKLNEDEKILLNNDINSIDFDLVNMIFNNRNSHQEGSSSDVKPLEPKSISKKEASELFSKGLLQIRNGEVAVVLMAGGQGTRLGHDGPKGTYDINLPSHKSLFNIQCDKLKRLYDLTGTYIKWYIMTSEDNHDETVSHFIANDYFSYSKDHIIFFKQDRLPLILENGKIAMKSAHQINLAANGNGGVFSSLDNQGFLEDMDNEGVKWVFLYGVDNVLAKVADPTFLSFADETDMPVASKAVDKVYPEEKVGVICYRNNHPDIVEYSELSDDLRYAKDENGQLSYRNGNMLSHYFKLSFLKECAQKSLPYHLAHKKVDYFDGVLNKADEPNGFKFELFMFDVFKYASDMAVLTVKREEEFAPVKNKEGKDSPKEARDYIFELHGNWLADAGYKTSELFEVKSDLTYQGEDLSDKNLEDITVVNIK